MKIIFIIEIDLLAVFYSFWAIILFEVNNGFNSKHLHLIEKVVIIENRIDITINFFYVFEHARLELFYG